MRLWAGVDRQGGTYKIHEEKKVNFLKNLLMCLSHLYLYNEDIVAFPANIRPIVSQI